MQYGKLITIESYNDGIVTTTRKEHEVPVFTDKAGILKEVIDAMRPLTSGESSSVTLEIKVNKQQQWRLIKRWSV